jgi:DNA modification methylase
LAPRLNTVYNRDCIAGLKRLDDGVVDLAFADPPFNIGYDYDVYHDKLESDRYLAWSRDWTAEVVRVLKPDGTFWLAIGDEYAAELKVTLQQHGLVCRNWVVWYYTFGVNCTGKFSRSHVHLFYMVKDPETFTFNAGDPAIRVPSARQLVYGDKRANPNGRLPDDTWILRPQDVPGGFSCEEDTWYFSRVCGTFRERAGWHACQMPEQLLGRIIRACSNEGDVVLDPFVGSGTTPAVAKKLRRRYIGFEISPEYTEKAKKRLAKIKRGDPLEGPAEPLSSAPSTANGRRLGAVKRKRATTTRKKARRKKKQ